MPRETLCEDEIRVQVPLSEEAVAKIDELGERMGGIPRGRMAAMLLEAGIEQNELLIKAVSSKWGRQLAEVLGVKKQSRGKGVTA